MNLVVNAIGDANCVSAYFSPFTIPCFQTDSFMIDYGKNTPQTLGQFLHHKHFFLSHFHMDHYKGLYDILKQKGHNNYFYELNDVYYPAMPSFSDKKTENNFKKLIIYATILGSESGCPAYDLINLLEKITSKKINPRGLSIDDSIEIGGKKIDVIWPPKKFEPSTEEYLANEIDKLHDLIESDKGLKEVWGAVENLELSNDDFFNLEKFDPPQQNINKINEYIKNKVINKIRKLTNSLSLCLYIEDELLFLGDLENDTIHSCMSNFFETKKIKEINVKYFITPHHGTHFHSSCEYIKADYVISSNGGRMIKFFRSDYIHTGEYFHNTYQHGDFINFDKSFSNIEDYLLKKIDKSLSDVIFGVLSTNNEKTGIGDTITFYSKNNEEDSCHVLYSMECKDKIIITEKNRIYVSECGDKNVAVMYKQ